MHRLRMSVVLLIIFVVFVGAFPAYAAPEASGLPIPRFVSLRATEANMRSGPGEQYPIVWTYRRQGLPLEVTAEYYHWRRVRDWQGAEGWMHSSMLSAKRSVIVTGKEPPLHASPDMNGAIVARLESNVIGKVLTCPKDDSWCEIQVSSVKGWLQRNEIWGVYKLEEID
ncbi:MAG: hypothetical protein IPK66_00630 [Rhodospirillales bacterium]|nr:hypothetical protein [Rhodospirillales bacterium]